MESSFLQPEDPRWAAFLKGVKYDFYHLPGYIELTSTVEGGVPAAFWAKERDFEVLIPLLIRSLPEHLGAPVDWCDALTPYGYPSPLLKYDSSDYSSEEIEDRFVLLLRQFLVSCEERNIISFFSRLHPIMDLPVLALGEVGEVVSHGETIYVDLTLSWEDLKSQIRRSHKKAVRRLKRAGFSVVVDNFDLLSDFVWLYHESMKRVEASDFYFFPEDYFYELVDLLQDRVHLFSVLDPDNLVVCSVLVTEVNGIMEGHLIGTREGFAGKSLNKLVLYEAIEWGKEHDNEVFHIGGGVGGENDTLFDFKAGFSDLRSVFKTWRLIVNDKRYEELSLRSKGNPQYEGEEASFFPIYRYA